MQTKVSIVRCNTYNPEEVEQGVVRAFELLGSISSFIKKGEKVLVKPNLLSARPAGDGVNTHTEVIRTVVRLIKKCGAFPAIGDNPGGSESVEKVYESSGILSMAKEEGAELIDAKNVKMVTNMPIASYFFECDKIISLPKMKTHSLMMLTGAVKNMFGAVAGLNKSQCHKRFPRPEDFVNVLVDVFEAVKPHLVLMDAVIAMDGDGPASGTLRSVGLLIASQDSVAVDTVFSYLIGIRPFDLLTTKEASRRGLGKANIKEIEILGEELQKCFINNFKLPPSKSVRNLPNFILKPLADLVKFSPYINQRLCTKCRICEKSCPVSAIIINPEISRIDSHRCIKCMCCHEVCPCRAVVLKRNILARAFGL